MLEAIVKEVSPSKRALAERSISASAGALFGVVIASALGLLAGRLPFTLDPAMLTLYASVIPLSITAFMVRYTSKMPRLPMLATLYFTALFVAALFFGEVLFGGSGALSIAGATVAVKKFVGFRVIGAAAFAGLAFRAVPAAGFQGETQVRSTGERRAMWEKRHEEAIRRLAMVDVDIREQQTRESRELDAFERRLHAELVTEDEFVLDVEAECRDAAIEAGIETSVAA